MKLPPRTARMIDLVTALTPKRAWGREHVAMANAALSPNRKLRNVESPSHIRQLAQRADAWFSRAAAQLALTIQHEGQSLQRKSELLFELEYTQFMYPPGSITPTGRFAPDPRNVSHETWATVVEAGRSAGSAVKADLRRGVKKHQRRLEVLGSQWLRLQRQLKKRENA